MRSLADRVTRTRWIAVPLAAYILVTLILPVANGAAHRADFMHHAAWVLAGGATFVTLAVIAGIAAELAAGALARMRTLLRGRRSTS